MNKSEFDKIESFMLEEMKDSAHDKYHIYRVLYSALDIAETVANVDMDVLLAACLLHDIGRKKQAENPEICHAEAGAGMALEYLLGLGWERSKAQRVSDCVRTHRHRGDNIPKSVEAEILFDADKLDVTGAIGIARTLVYEGQICEPLYVLDENGRPVVSPTDAEFSSFLQEYNYKLKNIYDNLYTDRARQLAQEYRKSAADFYDSLLRQIGSRHTDRADRLEAVLN